MEKRIGVLLCFLSINILFSQEEGKHSYIDATYFTGTILKHNPDISHLITGHPSGFITSFNRKTYGEKEWERLYNAPDYGISFIYQNLDNEFLGHNYGLYAHYNFYFFKRLLKLRVGQGIAYTTNPYDIDDNFRNVAYGSHLLSSTYFLLNLKKEYVFKRFGFQLGLGIIHYSNANFKAPNKSTNTFVFNMGFHYNLHPEYDTYQIKEKGEVKILGNKPIRLGILLRGGVNESDVVGSGQLPFYTLGFFADKALNKKSNVQLGAELFFSEALERFIQFRSTGSFNDGTTGDEDAKRVGIFLGHELKINKVGVLTQLGYYIYYPFDFEGQVYNRIGLQYHWNNKWANSITVRSHGAKAEAVEFSISYQL